MLIQADDFSERPLRLEHAAALETLPPHHADPFDRVLIAQPPWSAPPSSATIAPSRPTPCP
jgi:PIN domain nuclease of toxin-antitoxin system